MERFAANASASTSSGSNSSNSGASMRRGGPSGTYTLAQKSVPVRGSWLTDADRSAADFGVSLNDILARSSSGASSSDNMNLEWKSKLPGAFGEELCRVIGGLVRGSLILVGGDPGVGKSTLLLQVSSLFAKNRGYDHGANEADTSRCEVLYVSGEESASQIAMRARRISDHQDDDLYSEDTEYDDMMREGGGRCNHFDSLYIQSATRLDDVLDSIAHSRPSLVVIDSIQTLYLEDVTGSAGSVSQVKECTTALLQLAKQCNVTIFIIGHVTKQGIRIYIDTFAFLASIFYLFLSYFDTV